MSSNDIGTLISYCFKYVFVDCNMFIVMQNAISYEIDKLFPNTRYKCNHAYAIYTHIIRKMLDNILLTIVKCL